MRVPGGGPRVEGRVVLSGPDGDWILEGHGPRLTVDLPPPRSALRSLRQWSASHDVPRLLAGVSRSSGQALVVRWRGREIATLLPDRSGGWLARWLSLDPLRLHKVSLLSSWLGGRES